MVKMVDLITTSTIDTSSQAEQFVAEAINDDVFFEEYCYEDFNEYSLLESMYEEGIDSEDITTLDSEF